MAVFVEKNYKHHPIQIFSPITREGRVMTVAELNILMQGHNFLHTSASVHVCDLEIILTLAKTRAKFVLHEIAGKKVIIAPVVQLFYSRFKLIFDLALQFGKVGIELFLFKC